MTKKGAITRHIPSFPGILRRRMQGHEKRSGTVKGSFHEAFSEEAPGDKLSDIIFATKSLAIKTPRQPYANPFA
jgi:hypothetical protein